MDSLGAVELRNLLQGALGAGGVPLPSTVVFDYPTVRQLASLLHGETRSPVAATSECTAVTAA